MLAAAHTIRNKAPRATADALYNDLNTSFKPHTIEIIALDLWNYLGGPWEHVKSVPFETRLGDDNRKA